VGFPSHPGAHPGNGKATEHRVHEPNPRTPASLSVASAMPSSKHRKGVRTVCDAILGGGPLQCVRPEGHSGDHEYHSHAGSWVDDKHGDGGHG
jgi:hypothetical protein